MSKDIPKYVLRALRHTVREHNAAHPSAKATLPAAVNCYEAMPGEPFERFRQVKGWLLQLAGIEQRKAPADTAYRSASMAAGEEMVLEGYAALFNVEADIGRFREMIAPGAFDEVMEDDVRLLLNHEGAPLARTINNTLQLSTDDTGLHYRATLVNTQAGRDLYEMVKRGDITQSSFGFTIKEQETDGEGLHIVTKVGRLLDVSPVTYPAYKQSTVHARSAGASTES